MDTTRKFKKYRGKITDEYIENLLGKFKFSEYIINNRTPFDNKADKRVDFLRTLDRLNKVSVFPMGSYYSMPTTNMIFEDLLKTPEKTTKQTKYKAKICKLRDKMIDKVKFFKKEYRELKGDLELNKNILFNYSHYEIRDYIISRKNAEMCTNAWVKMYDLLFFNKSARWINTTLKEMRTFHMCELPGAFIAATNHFTKTILNVPFNWTAQSLFDKRNKNMLGDQYDLYKKYPKNYDFGVSGDGNLLNKDNIKYYIEKYRHEKFQIITADCGEELDADVDLKEDQIFQLQYNQFIIAIGLDTRHYYFKLYSMYSEHVNKLIMLARVFFHVVVLYKPYTVKITSDEVYLCCKTQKTYDRDIWKTLMNIDINKINIEPNFYKEIYKYNLEYFLERAININYYIFVLDNIEYVRERNSGTRDGVVYPSSLNYIFDLTRIIRNGYIKSYVNGFLQIKPIEETQKLMPNTKTVKAFPQNFSLKN